jgi:hypothetical protein
MQIHTQVMKPSVGMRPSNAGPSAPGVAAAAPDPQAFRVGSRNSASKTFTDVTHTYTHLQPAVIPGLPRLCVLKGLCKPPAWLLHGCSNRTSP